MPKPTSWGQMRRQWGAKIFDLTPEQRNDFIRQVIAVEDCFFTACLLDTLRFRFDAPELVFELLDELDAMQVAGTTEPEIDAWGDRARASLRRFIGDEPAATLSSLPN